MLPGLEAVFGNPSSIHQVGRQARAVLDDCRERSAAVLGCKPSEVIFTSGGTESVNLAVFGAARLRKGKGRHIITSSVEHHAVLHSCNYLQKQEGFEITILDVDRKGFVSPKDLKNALRPDTILVSIMAANNEIGTVQPIRELGTLCHEHGVLFHTDAVQWFGKEPFAGVDDFAADLVSICGHKFHGPKGTGALFARSPLLLEPILFGGAHENERRAGTENLAGILGFASALEKFVKSPVFPADRLKYLTEKLASFIKQLPGTRMVGPCDNRLLNTVSFVVEGADSISLLAGLDLEGVCASSGSACSSGSLEPSHVVRALGLSEELSRSVVRFSLGRESTLEEVEQVEAILPKVIERARRHW